MEPRTRPRFAPRRALALAIAAAVVAAVTVELPAPTATAGAAAPTLDHAAALLAVPPAPVDTTESAAQADGQALVRFEPNTDVDAVLRAADVDPERVVQRYDDGIALRADDEIRARLAAQPGVAGVDPDQVDVALGETPTSLERIHVPEAHAAGFVGTPTTGVVRVAIIDTGIDLDHPDLVDNIDVSLGKDCTGKGSFDDDHSHGTHVAGTVAAVADGEAVLGVAPEARLVPVKVLSAAGSGTRSQVICGLQHVLDLVTDSNPDNDVQVVNMSLGGSGSNPTTCAGDLERDVICKLTDAGVVVVVAAGNETDDAKYKVPAAFPEAVTVSALDSATDQLAYFSNYGAGIDIAAPGVSVVSDAMGGGISVKSGTSMASPAVAGSVAVVRAGDPDLTPAEVVSLLRSTGECPDHSTAGDDESCAAQGSWPGDPDGIVEPLVRLDDAVAPLSPLTRIVSPRRRAILAGTVPVTVRPVGLGDVLTGRVRVDGEAWHDLTGAAAAASSVGDLTWSWDTTTAAEGAHTLEAEVTGTTTQTVRADVTVRNGPTISITAPTSAAAARGDVTVRVTATHPTASLASLTGQLDVPGATGRVQRPLTLDAASGVFVGTWDTRPVADSAQTIQATVTDGAGRATTAALTVTVDNRPTTAIVAPLTSFLGGIVPVVATASSPAYAASALAVTWSIGSATGPLTLGTDGRFTASIDSLTVPEGYSTLKVTAKDPDGRVAVSSRTTTVRNAPTASFVSYELSGTVDLVASATSPWHPSSSLTVTATPTGRAAIPLVWDGTSFTAKAIDVRDWPEGTLYVQLSASDPDGRASTATQSLKVRNSPAITWVAPLSYANVKGDVRLALTVNGPYPQSQLSVSVTPDGQAAIPLTLDPATGRWTGSWPGLLTASGYRTLTASATDALGRTGQLARSVYVLAPVPEIVIDTPGSYQDVSGTVPISVTVTSPVVDSSQLTVTFVGGSASGTLTRSSGSTFTGSWPTASVGDSYPTLVVTATDPAGRAGTAYRYVYLRNAPTITVAAVADAGPVDLVATASSPAYPASALTVVATPSGADPVPLPWNGTKHAALGVDTSTWADGSTYLTVTVTDPFGRTSSAYAYLTVRNAPTVVIESPAGYAWLTGPTTATVRASSTTTATKDLQVSLSIGGGSAIALAYDPATGRHAGAIPMPTTPSNGYEVLRASATDAKGRTTSVDQYVYFDPADPVAVIHNDLSHDIDGVVVLDLTAVRDDGSIDDLTATWTIDGVEQPALHRVVGREAEGRLTANLDTVAVGTGSHTLRLLVTDPRTGLSAAVSTPFTVVRRTNFGVALVSPVSQVATPGPIVVEAVAYGTGATTDAALRAWYRVDSGGWIEMEQVSGTGRFRATWETRSLADGDHTIGVIATDFGQRLDWRSATVRVAGATPLGLTFHGGLEGALTATVPVTLTASGGVVGWDPTKLVSAWYRIDEGTWVALSGDAPALTASWDTALSSSGTHQVHVIAVDWYGGFATADRQVTVAPRDQFRVTLLSPADGARGASAVQVAVRAVSPTVGASGIGAWARLGSGAWVPLSLGADGVLRGRVPVTSTPVGKAVHLDVLATDWLGGVDTRTVSYTRT